MGGPEEFLIGVAVIHLFLVIYALRDLFTLSTIKNRFGKMVWVLLIMVFPVTGPIVYLNYGRGERSWSHKIKELQQRAEEQARNEENESL
ncbi:MAG: PLDc_N domain-containing protein [Chloroflexi bacterium]|mgnify:CR=1 FL=1|nr:PLDc_N domain-containing protein [Chloroflexota bacterium]